MKGTMHKKCSHAALQVDKNSSVNEFDELKPSMCEVDEEVDRKQDAVQEYFRNLGTYALADRGQLICRDHAIWLHCFWLQNGRASKTNIISTRPGTKQFISAHVEDVKGVFHDMWVHKTVTIFRNLLSLMLFDVG